MQIKMIGTAVKDFRATLSLNFMKNIFAVQFAFLLLPRDFRYRAPYYNLLDAFVFISCAEFMQSAVRQFTSVNSLKQKVFQGSFVKGNSWGTSTQTIYLG